MTSENSIFRLNEINDSLGADTIDLLGLTHEFNPRFLRRYMDLNKTVKSAIKKYVGDIKSHDFPNKNELY